MEGRSLPADLDSLGEFRSYVGDAAASAGIDAAKAYQLQLAVDEIITNIILYGYKDAAKGSVIAIGAEITDRSLVVTLRDRSPPFDPRTLPLPEAEELETPLENRKIGGLGIFLAFQGVDRFEYRHEDGSNLTVFEVFIHHE